MDQKLLVIGAAGGVGNGVVRRALDAGHRVRALDLKTPEGFEGDPRVETGTVNVLEDDLAPHMEGVSAVISGLGVVLSPKSVLDPPPLYSQGTLGIVRGMKRAGLRRLVVISASFVADRTLGPIWFRAAAMPALWRIFDQMRDMEHMLEATETIDWTAVRPGWLLDAPYTGDYTVSENVIPRGMIRTRVPDLAEFMLRCATSDDWLRKTPAVARGEGRRYTGPQALMAEVEPFLRKLPGQVLPQRKA